MLTFLNSELSERGETHQTTDRVSKKPSHSNRTLVVVPVVSAKTWHSRIIQPVPKIIHCLNLSIAKHKSRVSTLFKILRKLDRQLPNHLRP